MTSRSEIQGIFSMATPLPESCARTDVANTSVSRGLACACTRSVQCRCLAAPPGSAKRRQSPNTQRVRMPIDKGFDRDFATPKAFGAVEATHEAPHSFGHFDNFHGRRNLRPGCRADTDANA